LKIKDQTIMKIIVPGILLMLLIACSPKAALVSTPAPDPVDPFAYDSILAKRLGGNDNGMSQYVMAFLKRGPNRPTDSVMRVELQKAHMANINRMAEEGKLVMAGPFMDNGDYRGIYIFNVQTVEEAKALTETDPAIKYGSLVMELHPWYGSAGLKELNAIHKRITKPAAK
jgi:uncharacterized protein YciI